MKTFRPKLDKVIEELKFETMFVNEKGTDALQALRHVKNVNGNAFELSTWEALEKKGFTLRSSNSPEIASRMKREI